MVRRIRLSVFFPVESTIFFASESPLSGGGAVISIDGAGWMPDSESARKAAYGGVAAADSVGSGAADLGRAALVERIPERGTPGSPGNTAAAVVSGRFCCAVFVGVVIKWRCVWDRLAMFPDSAADTAERDR
jgi:hypothetical protein